MDSLEKLKRAIIAQIQAHVPVQTMWATCTSVDVQEGTMVATKDDAEFFDVLLGLGGSIVVPEPGTKVLLGLIENQPTAAILLFAERIAQQRINGDAFGGLVRADDVAGKLNTLVQEMNALKSILAAWVPVANDGGAALKLASQSWASQPMEPVVSQELQNTKVLHG